MHPRHLAARRHIALAVIASLIVSPIAAVAPHAQTTATPKPAPTTTEPAISLTKAAAAAQAPAAARAAASAAALPADGGWPRAYTTATGAHVVLYQPQVASWMDQKHMVAYVAVSYTASGADKPALGTLEVEADTSVSLAERLVSFSALKITEANFPTLPKDQVRDSGRARSTRPFPSDERVIALDRVLANVDKSQIIPKNVEGVKADPPPIFFSKTPAVARQPRRRADLEPDRGQRPEATRSTPTGICSSTTRPRRSTCATTSSWLQGRRRSTGRGRRPASCRPASRSCRPTTTGRT